MWSHKPWEVTVFSVTTEVWSITIYKTGKDFSIFKASQNIVACPHIWTWNGHNRFTLMLYDINIKNIMHRQ